jgi:hypothetical protein
MEAIGTGVAKRVERGSHAERVGIGDAQHVDWEVLLEIRLPAIVMHDAGHAGEEVLPGAREQSLAPRHCLACGDMIAIIGLDVLRPGAGIAVAGLAQPAIMIAV